MRRLTCRVLLLSLAAVLTTLLTGLGAGAATADDGNDLLSTDGVTWHATLTRPLFDPALRWVPGDVRQADFWVRNTHGDLGALDVVLDRTSSAALLKTGHLTISARAGDGPWVDVASGDRQVLVDSRDLAGGRQVLVEVRASFPYETSPNETMQLSTAFDLTVRLSQASAVLDAEGSKGPGGSHGSEGSPGPGAPAGPGGLLPNTGSPVTWGLLTLTLLLIGSGALLMSLRRRPTPAPSREVRP